MRKVKTTDLKKGDAFLLEAYCDRLFIIEGPGKEKGRFQTGRLLPTKRPMTDRNWNPGTRYMAWVLTPSEVAMFTAVGNLNDLTFPR